MKVDKLDMAVQNLLNVLPIGDRDPIEHHLTGTPRRVAAMYRQLLTPEDFKLTTFPNKEEYDEIVLADRIRFYSLCSHHLLPFFGVASVAYLPRTKYVGLSKLARTVRFFSRGLQVQERLTQQIGKFLWEQLEPLGVGVVLRGRHLCMEMRGVQAPLAATTTSWMKGAFRDNVHAREELMGLINLEDSL